MIKVSDSIEGDGLVEVVAHESAHLSMYQLTRGASATEPFRFFDEGYSDLVGKMIAGENMADHKRSSLSIANRQLKEKGLSFEELQHWSAYAGNVPSEKNFYTYPVGSSFVYFVIDSFGENKLFDFFRDIGETGDLDTSLRNIFGLTAAEVEQRWKDYVAMSSVPEPPLAITEMFPSNESSDIPVDIAELRVKFSVPMTRRVCVSTPCGDTGVCYKNARWKDARTLVIRTEGKLLPGTTYKLELGSGKQDCQLMSAVGLPCPRRDGSSPRTSRRDAPQVFPRMPVRRLACWRRACYLACVREPELRDALAPSVRRVKGMMVGASVAMVGISVAALQVGGHAVDVAKWFVGCGLVIAVAIAWHRWHQRLCEKMIAAAVAGSSVRVSELVRKMIGGIIPYGYMVEVEVREKANALASHVFITFWRQQDAERLMAVISGEAQLPEARAQEAK